MKEYPQEPLSVYSSYTGVATPINCNRFASLLAENWELISYEPDEDKQHTGPDLIILPSSSPSGIYGAHELSTLEFCTVYFRYSGRVL
ncbi:MAG: hypothetical protein ACNYNY_03920 [Candidatus Oxydemutatoraceae bacterium WSBS_2016_MAG_OTU14]